MVELLVHFLITAALLLLMARMGSGVEVDGWGSALRGAVVMGLVDAVVRPVMVVLTIPITLLTLGLFLLVVNALMLWLVATIVPGVKVKGFVPALLGSIVLSVLNFLVALVFGVTPNGG